MAQHQDTWPVSVLCEVLEVRRRGLYASRQAQATSDIDVSEMTVVARVKAMAAQTGHSDGRRRIAKPRQAEGAAVTGQARRVMHAAGISGRRRKRCPVTTDSRHGDAVAPNLLARQFDVAQPDTVWVGAMTDGWTADGWAYLAVWLDWYSRQGVGWAMQRRLDAAWVQAAWRRALGRRRPAVGLMHHADRGSQYACHAYQHLLADHGIRCRMSRTGECLDKPWPSGSSEVSRGSVRPGGAMPRGRKRGMR